MRSLIIPVIVVTFFLTACSHTYYVVRHAEKATPSPGLTMSTPNDPPLSAAGEQRAQALLNILKDKKVRVIFSTNTIRTRSTAEPLSRQTGVSIQTYGPRPDSAFIQQLKGVRTNVLVVGHSNTVDEIVNGLCNETKVAGDLADSEYDNLFVVKYKRFLGKKIIYERKKF